MSFAPTQPRISIGRLGENNEVNGSAAPPSQTCETRSNKKDDNNTTNYSDSDIEFELDTRLRSFPPSACLSTRLAVRPVLFDTRLLFANAASAMVLRQPVTPLSIHQSQAFDKQSPGSSFGPVTVGPVAVTVTVTASCMLFAGNCALHRPASPCLALHT